MKKGEFCVGTDEQAIMASLGGLLQPVLGTPVAAGEVTFWPTQCRIGPQGSEPC